MPVALPLSLVEPLRLASCSRDRVKSKFKLVSILELSFAVLHMPWLCVRMQLPFTSQIAFAFHFCGLTLHFFLLASYVRVGHDGLDVTDLLQRRAASKNCLTVCACVCLFILKPQSIIIDLLASLLQLAYAKVHAVSAL